MAGKGLDKRFCQVAIDALKTYRHKEFTNRFLKKHNLPVGSNLTQRWAEIQRWVEQGDDSRCVELLEYVDDLKMWGRQRIFLYDIDSEEEEEEFTEQLSDPEYVRDLVGDLYEKPVFHWEAGKPFLADVRHKKDPYTGARLLVFKIIEMRIFDQLIDGSVQQLDERTTNFFIVNLQEGFAELRLQQLPVRAHRSINDERDLIEEEIKKYLNFDKFKRIQLERVMSEIIRKPIYTITSTEFIASKDSIPGVPMLVTAINRLFEHPTPGHLSAYWECKQDVLGKSRLYFQLYGSNDSISFGGVADPDRVSDVLQKIIQIYRREESVWDKGLVDGPLKKVKDKPRAQAAVLASGAIAALLIWIVIEGVSNYLLEEWAQNILQGFPLIVITLLIELVWTVGFYGWNRINRSFAALRSNTPSQTWKAFKKAISGEQERHPGILGEQEDRS